VIGSLGMTELLVVAGIALLIFGPRQLPKFGRSMGEMVREFRGIGKEIEGDIE
jgi:sec-independent protein translocase protein TatA